jgi:hypothetical protein
VFIEHLGSDSLKGIFISLIKKKKIFVRWNFPDGAVIHCNDYGKKKGRQIMLKLTLSQLHVAISSVTVGV